MWRKDKTGSLRPESRMKGANLGKTAKGWERTLKKQEAASRVREVPEKKSWWG